MLYLKIAIVLFALAYLVLPRPLARLREDILALLGR